ncbi:MAG: CHASE domain-containing protein [Pseudomonadota bacterium]
MVAKLTSGFTRVLSAATGYALMGALGIVLSVQPVEATAIWPASGFALATVLLYGYRVWPGILLGAFIVNTWLYLNAVSIQPALQFLFLIVPISLSAILQAVAGAILIRRAIGFPNALKREADIVKFLLLGGPISCIIAATIGACSLLFGGVITAEGFLSNWLVWWFGDTIGVILFAPLTLIFFGRPHSDWRSRKTPVAVPLIISFILVVCVFIFASKQEANQKRLEFEQLAATMTHFLQSEINHDMEIMHGIRNYFEHSAAVRSDEFREFTVRNLKNRGHIEALAWITHLSGTNRKRFEEKTRNEGFPRFRIAERDHRGKLVRAGEADVYDVVSSIEPFSRHAKIHGLNLRSDAQTRAAMQKARDSGQAAATLRARPVGDNPRVSRIEIYLPVYAHGRSPTTPRERRQRLVGFVGGFINVERLVNTTLTGFDRIGESLGIYKLGSGNEFRLIYSDPDGMLPEWEGNGNHPPSLQWRPVLNIADQQWEMTFSQSAVFPAKTWNTWYILAGGFVFTGLLGAFLLILTGRTAQIAEEVSERTADMTMANRALLKEIWERKSMERALKQAKNDAEAANRAKSDFLAGISHELRTPLNGIIGFGQILQKDQRLQPDQQEQVSIISKCGSDLLALITDMLDLSKIELGGLKIENHPFILPDLVGYLVEMFTLRAQEKNIELCYEPWTTIPYGVFGDEKRLRQVLINLLTNAVKFTERGSVSFRVGYSGNTLRFEIEDTGIGIAESDLERVFLPFQQGTLKVSSEEGSGLGLAIARKLVDLMSGELRVESSLGKGSRFEVEMKMPEVTISDDSGREKPLIVGYAGRQIRILIVDDISANRSLLRGMLAPLGFAVETAASGFECLEKVAECAPDAILMDLVMADLDGPETTRKLRQSESGPNIVIIGISASAFSENRRQCLDAGCDDFIAKPVQLDCLLDYLRHHLKLTWIYAPRIVANGRHDGAPAN